jgi:hypothetical protein
MTQISAPIQNVQNSISVVSPVQNSISGVSGQLLAEIKTWKCRKTRQKFNCFQLRKPLPSIEGSKESSNAGK